MHMAEVHRLQALEDRSPKSICGCIAGIFEVKSSEVALLEVRGSFLKFTHPDELASAGAIPMSSSAVAASTARTRHGEVFNSFAQVPHSSIFELIKIGAGERADIIQKLMSVPITDEKEQVIGVLQVCRKGGSPATAGPDFTDADLQTLIDAAAIVGGMLRKP